MISDLIRFIAYNFRYPKQWYGDFLAQVGSLWVAEKRVKELCDRFGYNGVKGCFEEALNFGDRKMTEEIKKLPPVTISRPQHSSKRWGPGSYPGIAEGRRCSRNTPLAGGNLGRYDQPMR